MKEKGIEEVSLYQKLLAYSKSSVYPFHMPGHKRNFGNEVNPYQLDLTEIEGFDDLHHPNGILKESEKMAARVYDVQNSYYLVNGATSGIMAAIMACAGPGETILAASNCHRSVWNAVSLRNIKVIQAEAEKVFLPESGRYIKGEIKAEVIEQNLKQNPQIKAVIVTSPTYEGIVSPISDIAKIVHKYKIPLIVDEAHGAHLPFFSKLNEGKESDCDAAFFPESALKQGADLVVQSLHKTLPSLTQTAILHCNSDLVDQRELTRYYSMLQTTSPSYLLMASADGCIRFMNSRDGVNQMMKYQQRLKAFWEKTKEWNSLWFLYRDFNEKIKLDPSKIVFGIKKKNDSEEETSGSGTVLMKRLREEFALECEFCQKDYVVAMTSLMDSEEGFLRLEKALDQINREESSGQREGSCFSQNFPERKKEKQEIKRDEEDFPVYKEEKELSTKNFDKNEFSTWCLTDYAVGKILAEPIAVYPPGSPFLEKGQRISEEGVQQIFQYLEAGFSLDGIFSEESGNQKKIWLKVFEERNDI